MNIPLKVVRTAAPVPWSTGASTQTLNASPTTTLTYDSDARIVEAKEPKRVVLIPIDNVAYMLPISGNESLYNPAKPPPAEVITFAKPKVDDTVRYGRDAAGNVVPIE
jgi:hypothetical protein